ncbi:unnamed protein product [Auanema sp. JU1783]|nr:unnamed protein product [Auanema sp. JU1783]
MEEEEKRFELEMRSQQLKQQRENAMRLRSSSSFSMKNEKSQRLLSEPSLDTSSVIQEEEHWCYHCTSPIDHLSTAMKKTIREFLKLRRTVYPTEVATPECVSARNFSKLHKQTCKHRYCQTLALVDQDEGASFVLRGCAENFGAINSKQLDEQAENTCTKLHKKVDIRECICKERKYCYANDKNSASVISNFSSFLLSVVLLSFYYHT